MSVLEKLSDEECYLWAILSDPSGLDQAEFLWTDAEHLEETKEVDEEGNLLLDSEGKPKTKNTYCFRAWPYQWAWWRCDDVKQIDACGRSVGKSLSIKVRGFSFAFLKPGQEMLLTAPEGNHLDAITDLIETQILNTRLSREMLVSSRSRIKHRPFHVNFQNGARIMGRIPQRDGRGVKGQHPVWLELDEAQDYPDKGWIEISETLKRGSNGIWRSHGVTRGLRDYFYKYTQPESEWTVHRFCLPGETLVYTINGPKRIDEIVKGEKVWNISESGNLNFESVNETFDNGIKKLWKVKTKGGYSLTSTGNHPYLVLSDYGTRKTRRDLKFKWVEAENLKKGDVVVCVRELPNFNEKVESDLTNSVSSYSINREVPDWIWRASRETQLAFLYGYLMGDGSLNRQSKGQDAIAIGTGSVKMAKQLKALCHYLGIRATDISNKHSSQLSENPQYRFYVYLDESWFSQIPNSYSVHDLPLDKHFVARTVDSVVDTNEYARTYDISVGINHNFIAEGMVVHNTAMHRPTWTDEERQSAIKQYGSKENPDYRRNILGLHGDATNPLFVLHRLAKCIDYDLSSDYNTSEFCYLRINNEMVVDAGDDILPFLDLPESHKVYKNFWIGMDVGYTNHPSEILVFAEKPNKDKNGPTLKLLTRVKLQRIRNGHQVQVMLYLMDFYKPKAFSMDKTGVGLPLYQDLQDAARKDQVFKRYLDKIKGYNFSSNIVVDFDESIDFDPDLQDESELYVRKNVLEYASDRLRGLVDENRLLLPYTPEGGEDVVAEFQGQTWSYDTNTMTTSGRKKSYSQGKFHALDAAKMAVLGYQQHGIEKALKVERFTPVTDVFIY